jgi:hypothetical protein
VLASFGSGVASKAWFSGGIGGMGGGGVADPGLTPTSTARAPKATICKRILDPKTRAEFS